MKNVDSWIPTKFIELNGALVANPDKKYVSISSRLNVNLLGNTLSRVLKQYAKGRLVDLGCGKAPLYMIYKSIATEITCVDWSNTSHGMSHLDIEADLNENLPLASNRYDTVLLTDVMEHIHAPEHLIKEIKRILCTNGRLIGTVPFSYRLHEEPHDYYRYTIYTLQRMAENNGFAIEILEAYGSGTDVLFDVLGKILVTVHWRFGPYLANWSQSLGWWIRNSDFGRKLNKKHHTMPVGYVFVLRAIE